MCGIIAVEVKMQYEMCHGMGCTYYLGVRKCDYYRALSTPCIPGVLYHSGNGKTQIHLCLRHYGKG